MSDTTTDTPRIWVSSLSDYNAGRLHGRWIDATDAGVIREEIEEMLAESSEPIAEEWAIHDLDNFCGLDIHEYEDIDKVAELGRLIAEHGGAFAAYANHVGVDCAAEESFQEAYCGEWESEEKYAEDLFNELYLHEVPEHIQCYIDYEAFSRDLFINDCYSVDNPEGGVYVFRHC